MKESKCSATHICAASLLLLIGVLRNNSFAAAGDLDLSFDTGSGINGAVRAVVVQADGKFLIGGGFNLVNGTSRDGVARLNANGTLDTSFNPGSGYVGVRAIALQPDGKVLIGDFFNVSGSPRHRIARLNPNGSLDPSFNPGSGADAAVTAMTVQPDGNILVAGNFLTVNGVPRPYIARLYGDYAKPGLNMARSNSIVALSWPAAFGNFQLQQNTDVSVANGWSAVAASGSTNNGFISVTLPAIGSGKFFRLSSP
jgi:uncharacterized delta-60 repeat protein